MRLLSRACFGLLGVALFSTGCLQVLGLGDYKDDKGSGGAGASGVTSTTSGPGTGPGGTTSSNVSGSGPGSSSSSGMPMMCGGVTVDLSTDPVNCGACAHDCLGGMCSASKCEPYAATSVNGNPGRDMILRNGLLYWIAGPTTGGASLQVTDLTIFPPTTAPRASPLDADIGRLCLAFPNIVFHLQNTGMFRSDVTMFNGSNTIDNGIANPGGIGCDLTFVHYGAQSGLLRESMPSPTPAAPTKVSLKQNVDVVRTTLNEVYFSNPSGIYHQQKSVSAPGSEVMVTANLAQDFDVTTTGEVMWGTATSLNTMTGGTVITYPANAATRLVIDEVNHKLYVALNPVVGDASVIRVGFDGTGMETLYTTPRTIAGITISQKAVLFEERFANKVVLQRLAIF